MILTKEKIKALVKKVDDMVTLPWWIDAWDGQVMQAGIEWLDEKYGDKIPEQFRDDINNVVDLFIAGDYEGIVTAATPEFIDSIVNIPGLDDDLESKVIAINVKALFEIIKHYAAKKTQP